MFLKIVFLEYPSSWEPNAFQLFRKTINLKSLQKNNFNLPMDRPLGAARPYHWAGLYFLSTSLQILLGMLKTNDAKVIKFCPNWVDLL